MIAKLKPVYYFYRRFLLPSVLFNFLLLFLKVSFPVALSIKVLFFALLLFVFLFTKQKYKLTFYQNLSINTSHLFILSFLADAVILAITYLIFSYAF